MDLAYQNHNNDITIIPFITQVEESGSEEDIDTFTSPIIAEEEKQDAVELVKEQGDGSPGDVTAKESSKAESDNLDHKTLA